MASGREYVFTRPNREPKNKLGWGVFSGGVTVRKVTDTLKKMNISTGHYRNLEDAARNMALYIENMPQMHHGNTQMTAISLYLLYDRMNYDNRGDIDMEELNRLIDENMNNFMIKIDPEGSKKAIPPAVSASFKTEIVRYITAIIDYVRGFQYEVEG